MNPLGLKGIEFVEFSSYSPEKLHQLFTDFGFSRTLQHNSKKIDLYKQNDINFLLNTEPGSHADKFVDTHGPCICSMGWRFENAKDAHKKALANGAKAASGDYDVPAIEGIGGSLIYFIDGYTSPTLYKNLGFGPSKNPTKVPEKGFVTIDHLTNNVYNGTMEQWAGFYKNIFGFTQVRYFDIKGKRTGLQSFALKSPDGSFCIPINEAQEKKSQINEYLDEYKGPGVQHLAFLTTDILKSLKGLQGSSIKMLDISEDYYQSVFNRVPNVTEDKKEIERYNVLVDGDEEGYLLQIFTKNLVGPIFIEIIQRKNHHSFGEGNFQALFDSIERDQEKRGIFAK